MFEHAVLQFLQDILDSINAALDFVAGYDLPDFFIVPDHKFQIDKIILLEMQSIKYS